MSEHRRRLAVRAAVAVAGALGALALVTGYVERTVVDSDRFADRATVAVQNERLREPLAERIADDVVLRRRADLITARPLIEALASQAIDSDSFGSLFRAAVRDVHRALFRRDQSTLTLTVTDLGTVLAAGLGKADPRLAEQLRASERVELARYRLDSLSATLLRLADDVRVLALALLGLCGLLVAVALALSRDRRATAVELGIATASAGLLVLVGLAVLRVLTVDQVVDPEARGAAAAIWDAFLGGLRTSAWVVTAGGVVIATAAASLVRPIDATTPLRWLGRRIGSEPRGTVGRLSRAALLLLAGLALLLEGEAVLQLAIGVAGAYLLFAGVAALFALTFRPAADRAAAASHAKGALRRSLAVSLAVLAALVAIAVSFLGGSSAITAAAPASGCNGHAELCERRLDEVAMVATHNAMSAPQPGWFSSQQDRPIPGQLRDGVRALLIDTHYADRLPNGRLRTYFGSAEELQQQVAAGEISQAAIDAALRSRERLGFEGEGKRGMYLCHTFCELGGLPLEDALGDVREFLVTNPGEVVVIVNQDYVTAADFVAAVQEAGLEELVYRGPIDDEMPTLGWMVEHDQRLVLLAEDEAGAAPWYRPAYEGLVEETPFSFSRPAELTDPERLPASCAKNRGRPGSPLFLLNHWITTDPVPRPSNAERVNAAEPLLRRARECARLRGQLPNLIAIDFYRRGDAFDVVEELNGTG